MSRFADVLRRTHERLLIPQPVIALTGSILCALLWYLAETKVASIESDEAACLADLAA